MSASATLPTRILKLRHGRTLGFSTLGFGGAPLGNLYRPVAEAEAVATVEAAWRAGMRYFDTAPLYGFGLSERRLGTVLRTQPRDSFVLSTKVGRVLQEVDAPAAERGVYVDTGNMGARFDYSYTGVMRSVESSLRRLGLDRVDILYVHDIDVLTHGSSAAAEGRLRELLDLGGWRALQELRRSGTVAAIGAGVNEFRACLRLLQLADPDIFLLAGRYTLLDQCALERLFPECAARGVGIVAGGPYNSGILATGAIPGARYDYEPASPAILVRTREIQDVCIRHGVALADAALHFPLTHPLVVAVIPGSQTPLEVEHNAEMFANPPPPALWRELAERGFIPQPVAAGSH